MFEKGREEAGDDRAVVGGEERENSLCSVCVCSVSTVLHVQRAALGTCVCNTYTVIHPVREREREGGRETGAQASQREREREKRGGRERARTTVVYIAVLYSVSSLRALGCSVLYTRSL